MHSRKIDEVDITEILKFCNSLTESDWVPADTTNDDKRYFNLKDQTPVMDFVKQIADIINSHFPFEGLYQVNLVKSHADFQIPEHADRDPFYRPEGAEETHPHLFTKDYDRLLEGYGIFRYHIPIITDVETVTIMSDGDPIKMAPGEIWWLDHYRPHAIINEGAVDRIHFLIDVHNNRLLHGTHPLYKI